MEISSNFVSPKKWEPWNGNGYGKSLGNTVPMYQPKFGNDVSLVRQGFMLQIDMRSIH